MENRNLFRIFTSVNPIKKMKLPDSLELHRWCTEKLGESKCKRIAYVFEPHNEDCGWWDWDGTIWVNLSQVKRMISLQKTLLHEWTHAQQAYRWYNWYDIKYGYKKNPYEIQAFQNEKLVKRAYRKKNNGSTGS